jgi:tetratricopeptide (TPR) repeat protein
MGYRAIDINEFLSRLDREEKTETPPRFTWLIGSGFSYSAGIPLAKDVSHILALYEYIGQNRRSEFEDELIGFGYDQKQLHHYLDWYYALKENNTAVYDRLIEETYAWLASLKHFENIKKDSPECYQSLFTHLLYDQRDHHKFLTSIIQRNTGINVAHIGLAGLLRDHPKWGHTVFTTNFDDLLLKASLSLNHTIRIFGELKSDEKPIINPTYPQIVHLHGRHTGYNLLNTNKQITSWFIPKLKESFEEHIGNTNLIVIGYSGWDDLVMQTLKAWDNNQMQKIGGNLYWVPYQSEDTIDEKGMNFLNNCPDLNTFIITNAEKSLNADSFILALTNTINKRQGGFGTYRKDLLGKAKDQHAFIMRQLKEYPDSNPEGTVAKTLEQVDICIKSSEIEKATTLLNSAAKIISQPDIEMELKAKSGKQIGVLYYKLGNLPQAINMLSDAITNFKSINKASIEIRLDLAKGQRILAEVLINNNTFPLAYDCIKNSIYESSEILLVEDLIDARINIVLCKISRIYFHMLVGNFLTVEKEIWEIQDSLFLISGNIKANAKYLQINGLLYIQKSQFEKAKEYLNQSSELYDTLKDSNKLLNDVYLTCIKMKERKFQAANEDILKIKETFFSFGDPIGVGICNHLIGFFNSQKQNWEVEDIESYYKLAIGAFDKANSSYNAVNVLVDYYSYKSQIKDSAAAKTLLYKIQTMDVKNNKHYKTCIK